MFYCDQFLKTVWDADNHNNHSGLVLAVSDLFFSRMKWNKTYDYYLLIVNKKYIDIIVHTFLNMSRSSMPLCVYNDNSEFQTF